MPKPTKEPEAVKRVKTSLSLPEDLWRTTRVFAIQAGVDAQDVVEAALSAYLQAIHDERSQSRTAWSAKLAMERMERKAAATSRKGGAR